MSLDHKLLVLLEDYDRLPDAPPVGIETYWVGEPEVLGTIPVREPLRFPLSERLRTAEGRAALAREMVQPLRMQRDYTSIGRRTFLVEQLPEGALPTYDRSPDISAFVSEVDRLMEGPAFSIRYGDGET